MIKALNHISRIRLIRLFAFLTLVVIAENVKAQLPGPPYQLRITNYRDDLMWGYGASFATIKFYYAEPGSFNPRPGEEPFNVVTADEMGFWTFFIEFENRGKFIAPVVVSMTPFGGTVETFESPVLGPGEVFIWDRQSCAETQNLMMWPAYIAGPVTWRERSGRIAGEASWLSNAPPGTYTLSYTNLGGRTYSSGSVTFEGTPHAFSTTLYMDCGESSIDYTGEYDGSGASFRWVNQADGTTAGTTQRVRLAPGKYDFYVTNNEGCQSAPATVTVVSSPPLASIDISGKVVNAANCGQSNGSISGIKVFPANNETPKYRWIDDRGNVYTTLDIHNLLPGNYRLEAYSDENPCPTFLTDVIVGELNAIKLDQSNFFTDRTSCGLNNGGVTNLKTNATHVRWYVENFPDVTVSTDIEFRNAAPGFYMLELSNDICTKTFGPFHIAVGSPAIEVSTQPTIQNDNCHLSRGSITGIRFNTSVSYTWLNAAGEEVGRNGDLVDVPAGTYKVVAKSDKCENSFDFIIGNDETTIAPPAMKDILICAASSVLITFKETADIFRIYDAGGVLMSQSNSPSFNIRVDHPGLYYAALASGTCESTRTMFSISFGGSGLEIPSAFSPNGDGQNDKWVINGIDVYLTPEIKIFNRQGMAVFHSRGRSLPFDGKSKGSDLPVGVYYYLVKASPECPPVTGSLTLIR